MNRPRRTFLQLVGAALAAPTVPKVAKAETYPTRPITMIVPFAAGGTTDVIGRVVAARMSDSLKQPPEVEAEFDAWSEAKSLDEEEAIARRLNKAAFDYAFRAPLGWYLWHQAWRKNSAERA
jgi:hypothetical protein